MRKSLVTYSRDKITAATEKASQLTDSISVQSNNVKNNDYQVKLYEQNLTFNLNNIRGLNQTLRDLKNKKTQEKDAVEKNFLTIRINKIKSDLEAARVNTEELSQKLLAYKTALMEAVREKMKLESEMADLTTYTDNANNFFDNFSSNSKAQFNRLITTIRARLVNYDSTHFNQKIHERLFLNRITDKLNSIEKLENKVVINNSPYEDYLKDTVDETINDNAIIWREKYLILVGFLWNSYNDIDQPQNFKDEIFSLICEGHIDDKNDLPDELATNKSCNQHYSDFAARDVNKSLFMQSENDFINEENRRYDDAFKQLQEFSNSSNSEVHQSAKNLLNLINKKANKNQFDKKTYTEILTLSHKLSTATKHDPRDAERYYFLAQRVPGTPSTAKKIGGIMLAILGMAIIALSVSAAIASFGGSSIFSALGIVIGATLLAQSLSTLSSLVGLSVVAAGYSLFNHGKRKDISQSMHTHLEKVTRPAP